MLLLYLYDRLFWLTIAHTLLAHLTYNLLPLAGASPLLSHILTFAVLGTYLVKTLDHLDRERRIRQLGKRATSLRTHTPFNIGVLLQVLWYLSKHRTHEYWWKMFGQRPGGGGVNIGGENGKKFPYTVETITIGGRLVLTADEENVKAILATQFADYGKGPQFRKEWKDFLGLSRFFLFFSTSSEILLRCMHTGCCASSTDEA